MPAGESLASLMIVILKPFDASWFAHMEITPMIMTESSRKIMEVFEDKCLMLLSSASFSSATAAAVEETAEEAVGAKKGW